MAIGSGGVLSSGGGALHPFAAAAAAVLDGAAAAAAAGAAFSPKQLVAQAAWRKAFHKAFACQHPPEEQTEGSPASQSVVARPASAPADSTSPAG